MFLVITLIGLEIWKYRSYTDFGPLIFPKGEEVDIVWGDKYAHGSYGICVNEQQYEFSDELG